MLLALRADCLVAADEVVSAEDSSTFTAEQIEFFESHVRPVLIEHCYDCHSTDAKELKAELYVDSRKGTIVGGETGASVVPGKPEESPLIAAVKYETNEMPPDRKLSDKDIQALVKWVEIGAPWPQVTTSPGLPVAAAKEIDWDEARAGHWAWKPVQKPSVPQRSVTTSQTSEISDNAIDNFVAAQREAAGLQPNDLAPLPILARRIYLDLIGVIPMPEQANAFTQAAQVDRSQAVGSLVDALLQSPLYGQRWGRHWLDVARYSDGRGGFLDNDTLDNAWRYRDWVVDAFNSDQPIDDFLRLQIAGDIIGSRHDAVATGFFAVGPTYRSDGGDPDSVAQAKGETLDDRIDTLTRGLMGITGSCARCHDHKFDPIPQQDYYSLAGVFNNSDVHKLPLAEQEIVDLFNQHKKDVNDLNQNLKKLRQKLKKDKREATVEEKAETQQWTAKLEQLKANPPASFDIAHALKDTGSKDMHVAIRGNLRKTGKLAPRRFLRIVAGEDPPKFTSGSGRGELAEAIVDDRNPLTARVFVNRVWMQHFGAALVRTPSNFGALGERPTHPQLLDWLAADFVENGWSLKRLHRQIMTSATYQLSSSHNEAAYALDGDNRTLWRMNPRRMDVEVWRDSLLSVTGELDCTLGGPATADIAKDHRRTLYAKVSRNGDVFESDRFLRRFDFPLMRATVAQRPSSIVPQQFLFLLNSPFMVERSKSLVSRLNSEASTDEERIERAYDLLYGRRPDAIETKIGLGFLKSVVERELGSDAGLSGWDQYAQALLSSNEFMYVR